MSQVPGIGRVRRFDGYQVRDWNPEVCRDCRKEHGKVTMPAFSIMPENSNHLDRYWLCEDHAAANGVVMLAVPTAQKLF